MKSHQLVTSWLMLLLCAVKDVRCFRMVSPLSSSTSMSEGRQRWQQRQRTEGILARRSPTSCLKAAESEVSFSDDLDGSKMRIGIIRTRWNEEHVTNLVNGVKEGLKDCKVSDENVFETSVPGSYELPVAARFLALSGTVDAIICVGVLIKGETYHFEYIADAVSKGLMNVAIQTSTPVILGVLTCQNVSQVKARSTGSNNHGVDWGKTAVEMALLRTEALGGKGGEGADLLEKVGFGAGSGTKEANGDGAKRGGGFF